MVHINVNVVDSMIGSGKTSAVINFINNSDSDKHFLYITPYLTEVQRIIDSCPSKNFKQPKNTYTKLKDIKKLFENNENIASTHSLFSIFDDEIAELAKANNYTLIMDEVINVIEPCFISRKDADVILEKYAHIDPESCKLVWHDKEYRGKLEPYKKMCETGCIACYNKRVLVWLFPINVIKAFNETIILTYLFEAQPIKYYYDYYGITYSKLYVKRDSKGNYEITDQFIDRKSEYNYSELINILDRRKLNAIGETNGSLSQTWYAKHYEDELIKKLRNHCRNYFINIVESPSSDNLWTTFTEYKKKVSDSGYTKGFIPFNMRATNDYKHKSNLAYLVNRYFNPFVKNFFVSKGIKVDEDLYATSEMLQFIWRSAIRDGKPINIYIPSKRMRTLLQEWIESVSESSN